MLIRMNGAALQGVDAFPVSIEVFVGTGAQYFLIGLPDSAVRESWKRMETAIRAIGMKMPRRRIVINLAPADLPKKGAGFDLAMAIGILAASGQIPAESVSNRLLWGELALNGNLRPGKGALSIALAARDMGMAEIIVPEVNAAEAAFAEGTSVYGAADLRAVVKHLAGVEGLSEFRPKYEPSRNRRSHPHLTDVVGQSQAKRALELAAAGGHNLIMSGPPGSGKTMLAKRLPGVMPPLEPDEAIETTQIHSVAGTLHSGNLVSARPFRAPHHTCSNVALVGGGNPPLPGEISLAHHGILYLDEMPEFKRHVLEVLRQPMEDGSINIARARYSLQFPSKFMLVASMNPCPCGFRGHPEKTCECHPSQVQRYRNRISGPLMDRFDIQILVQPLPLEKMHSRKMPLKQGSPSYTQEEVRGRISAARVMQQERLNSNPPGSRVNGRMNAADINRYCPLEPRLRIFATKAAGKLGLSARAYARVLKVARTAADLDASHHIRRRHLVEALSYRQL